MGVTHILQGNVVPTVICIMYRFLSRSGGTIAALASILTLAIGENETTVRFATFGYFVLGSILMFMAALVAISALKSNYLSFSLEVSRGGRVEGGIAASIYKPQ